jgi:hypothetical protein
MADNPSLAFSLSARLKEQLEAEALIRGVKSTELVRMLVLDFIEKHGRAKRLDREGTDVHRKVPTSV